MQPIPRLRFECHRPLLTSFTEGEQFANAFFTLETKIKIAKA